MPGGKAESNVNKSLLTGNVTVRTRLKRMRGVSCPHPKKGRGENVGKDFRQNLEKALWGGGRVE